MIVSVLNVKKGGKKNVFLWYGIENGLTNFVKVKMKRLNTQRCGTGQ